MILLLLGILLKTLLFTCIVEGILVLLIMRKFKYVMDNITCNLLTNPLLNLTILFLVNLIGYKYYYVFIALSEMIVIGVECWLYKLLTELDFNKRMLLSVVTNMASFFLGIFI